ncbi:MAG: tetratricopeptide repeat protein [Acidobacteria bacterium]|nr:tetratricopeptide repeat protein [Acidobacteriota bacterium]
MAGQFTLTADEMETFGLWLSLGVAERTGRRGHRQKKPMPGMFVAWGFGGQGRKALLRGSDFDFRIALLVHGWRRAGLPIQRAAERTAEYSFVRSRLGRGKRGRRSDWGEGVTEVDETVRTTYYKLLKRRPNLDELLESWYWHSRRGWEWVRNADQRELDCAAKRGGPEDAELFLDLVRRIRAAGGSGYRDENWYVQAEARYLQKLAARRMGASKGLCEGSASLRPSTLIHVWATGDAYAVVSLINLAKFYCEQGKAAQADPVYREALAITQNVLGPEHADTVWISDQLKLCQRISALNAKAGYPWGLPIAQEGDHPGMMKGDMAC